MCAEAPPFIHMRCINEEEEGHKECGLRVPLPCETTLVREGHRRVTVLYCSVLYSSMHALSQHQGAERHISMKVS